MNEPQEPPYPKREAYPEPKPSPLTLDQELKAKIAAKIKDSQSEETDANAGYGLLVEIIHLQQQLITYLEVQLQELRQCYRDACGMIR